VISQLQAVQYFLYALKFMNRLDEVLLLSLEDPDFLPNIGKEFVTWLDWQRSNI
jgi:hypothetical protein